MDSADTRDGSADRSDVRLPGRAGWCLREDSHALLDTVANMWHFRGVDRVGGRPGGAAAIQRLDARWLGPVIARG
jgi:hypothetical protein